MDLQQLRNEFQANKKMKFIFFWGHTEKSSEVSKACFSQWYPAPFILDNVHYMSTEHYMMAEKARIFNDIAIRERILSTANPGAVKALGREIKDFNQAIWDKHRVDVVTQGNLAKFSQNVSLGDFLLSTGTRVIVEASPVDRIWGVGLSEQDPKINNPLLWNGLNLLGFALMDVRTALMKK